MSLFERVTEQVTTKADMNFDDLSWANQTIWAPLDTGKMRAPLEHNIWAHVVKMSGKKLKNPKIP